MYRVYGGHICFGYDGGNVLNGLHSATISLASSVASAKRRALVAIMIDKKTT